MAFNSSLFIQIISQCLLGKDQEIREYVCEIFLFFSHAILCITVESFCYLSGLCVNKKKKNQFVMQAYL